MAQVLQGPPDPWPLLMEAVDLIVVAERDGDRRPAHWIGMASAFVRASFAAAKALKRDVRELYSRTARLNDRVAALEQALWADQNGSRLGRWFVILRHPYTVTPTAREAVPYEGAAVARARRDALIQHLMALQGLVDDTSVTRDIAFLETRALRHVGEDLAGGGYRGEWLTEIVERRDV